VSILLVCPEGGLANRLRVLGSALALQQAYGCPLSCYWVARHGELHAPFYKLFEPIPGLHILDPPAFLDKLRPVLSRFSWRRHYLHLLNRRLGIARYVYEDSSHPGVIEAALPSLRPLLERDSGLPVLIRTWQGFANFQLFLNAFIPIEQLQARINSRFSPADPHLIGVHVRRSDHLPAIRYSPLVKFFAAVDSALLLNAESQLFLCSDDASVRLAFQRRYGKRVIVSEAELSRSSTAAIQDAVVDLFCLARCSSIIGSYHSSFSELAAMLGHRPLQTIGPDGYNHAS
jgi:hypothetical protein